MFSPFIDTLKMGFTLNPTKVAQIQMTQTWFLDDFLQKYGL